MFAWSQRLRKLLDTVVVLSGTFEEWSPTNPCMPRRACVDLTYDDGSARLQTIGAKTKEQIRGLAGRGARLSL
jgi:hypothetical protein